VGIVYQVLLWSASWRWASSARNIQKPLIHNKLIQKCIPLGFYYTDIYPYWHQTDSDKNIGTSEEHPACVVRVTKLCPSSDGWESWSLTQASCQECGQLKPRKLAKEYFWTPANKKIKIARIASDHFVGPPCD
jgi:hypothetical protein